MSSENVVEERSFDSLSPPHFPRVIATTMKSITRRIYHKGLNAQRSLVSLNEKLRKRKGREPYATAQTLPDDVLLEIFKYHRPAHLLAYPWPHLETGPGPWKWYRLAQVCRRWRFVVFAYPRLLDLRIVCTKSNPIWKTPDFWSATIPITMRYCSPFFEPRVRLPSAEKEDIFDILKNPARIREMEIEITSSLLKKCAALLEEPFPALEYLRLEPLYTERERTVLPENFLGNSAPRLRAVCLRRIVFPTLPRLLSTSQNLVSIQLEDIPPVGIFTAQDLVVGLSSATQLESLKIVIHGVVYPRPTRQNELAPRSVLPALLQFQYVGDGSYLDDFASRIDTPIIEQIRASLSSEIHGYNTYELCRLSARGEELRSSRRRTAHIRIFSETVHFAHHSTCSTSSPVSFQMHIDVSRWLNEHVTVMGQICLGFQSLGIMHKVTRLKIEVYREFSHWHMEEDTDRWLTLLRTLSGVKRLHVVGTRPSSLVFALAHVSGEETGAILPALRDIYLPESSVFETPVDIEPFIAARKLYGLPVSVHYKGLDSPEQSDCSGE